MGIFSNIRNSIYNVISYVKINWNLTNIFYPYFNKNESFHSLKKLEESIDIEITNIYNELKLSPKKYSYPISRYESFLPKVREHNNKVELIDKGIEGFYYQSYIDNPIKRNVEELNPYLLVVEQIEGYSYYEDKYKTFCTQVKDLKNNFEIIKEQFLLKDLYSESFTFNDDAYYDESFKKALINKLEPLLSSLAKVKKSYYDFSKLKKINQLIIEHNNKFVKKHLNDEIFDNIRGNSLDSRDIRVGLIKEEDIVGITTFRLFPFNRIGVVK